MRRDLTAVLVLRQGRLWLESLGLRRCRLHLGLRSLGSVSEVSRKRLGSVSEVSKGRGGGVLEGRSWAAAYLACTSDLGCTSPAPRTSAASRLHIGCISTASRLHLACPRASSSATRARSPSASASASLRSLCVSMYQSSRLDSDCGPMTLPTLVKTSCRCTSQPPTHGTQLLRLRRRRRLGRTPPLLLHLELPRVELREPARRVSRRVPSLTGASANRLMRRLGSGPALPLLELGQSRAISGNLG